MVPVKDETELTEEELGAIFEAGRPIGLVEQPSWFWTTDSHVAVQPVADKTFRLASTPVYVSPRVSTSQDQEGSRAAALQDS